LAQACVRGVAHSAFALMRLLLLLAAASALRLRADPDVKAASSVLPSPLWAELNAVLKPFQLVEGYVTQEPTEVNTYIQLAREDFVNTVCETGFNAGQSALIWLLANPKAKLYSFDLGQYGYTQAAAKFMAEKFPGRFTFVAGNSVESLPKFIVDHPEVRCDLTIVDGGHTVEVATADLLNFAALASPVSRVVVDDTPCQVSWCMGPNVAWANGLQNKLVRQVRSTPMGTYRGFVVGEFLRPDAAPALAATQAVPMLESKALVQLILAKEAGQAATPYVINFGAGDGRDGMPGIVSNNPKLLDPTYPLFTDLSLPGVAVEGNPDMLQALSTNLPSPAVAKKIALVTPASVPQLLQEAKAPNQPTYFKNDIDGYDCAVDWALLKAGYRPKAMQLEVNPEIPWPLVFGVGYSAGFKPALGLGGFYGCSLKLTVAVADAYGYDLVGVGDTHDAFFLRRDVRAEVGVPAVDGAAAASQLLKCCSPHQFGLGAAESWAEAARTMPATELVAALKPALEQACKASQHTAECDVPYALGLEAAEYLALQ